MASERLLVLGAGQMGSGIAQVALQAGFKVTLADASGSALSKARERIAGGLAKLQSKGLLTEAQVQASTAALTTHESSGGLSALRDFDFAVEAVTENEGLKRTLFGALDGTVKPGGVLATNTSSISITRIAAATRRPDAVIGMHFMNPVPLMKLVELIRGAATSDATYEKTRKLAEQMGKTTVLSRDYPGFIVNRVLIPMINEACFALMEGVASASDIDVAMKLGTNIPMGPLELADFIGLDTCLSIAQVLHEGLGDDKYRPSPLLRQYVDAGWLGKKSGRGFHTYPA